MNLKSGTPFWSTRNGLLHAYPRLKEDLQTEVIVLGAGITGSLIAYHVQKAGFDVVLLDKRDVATGSTSASTALLQYEIDTPLCELTKKYGFTAASAAYRGCLHAITSLKSLSESLGGAGSFAARPSLYYASNEDDAATLEEECRLRQESDLPVQYWDQDTIKEHFNFSAPAALYSRAGGEIDPHFLTHALLRHLTENGARIYDKTEVNDVLAQEGQVSLRANGHTVSARHIIIAAGYESQSYLPQPVARLRSTYALASEPLAAFTDWYQRSLIWETARPYLYMRTTDDRRLIAGGEDVPFKNVAARDALLTRKTAKIEAKIRALFPRLAFDVDLTWCGTFAETKDGLPYIGRHKDRPGMSFALCYGGNGITYSQQAAEMLTAHLKGEPHPMDAVYGFDR